MKARLVVFPVKGRNWCFSRSVDRSVSESESVRIPPTLKDLWKKISSNRKPMNKNAELVLDFVSNKMNQAWIGLEKAPEGTIKNKIHGVGLRLLARVKPSEIFLKSISKEVTKVEVTHPTRVSWLPLPWEEVLLLGPPDNQKMPYASAVGAASRSGCGYMHQKDFSFEAVPVSKKPAIYQGEPALFDAYLLKENDVGKKSTENGNKEPLLLEERREASDDVKELEKEENSNNGELEVEITNWVVDFVEESRVKNTADDNTNLEEGEHIVKEQDLADRHLEQEQNYFKEVAIELSKRNNKDEEKQQR
ncbi:hypothetical protein HHK36_021955 [Tetracentron sinense]|uniref:Uncharacterized protein n=1 Tax=Tetracentron sinense TaxID=13715 RepID=A0A835D7J7_TETSI|nr:hypothetical protein HHK36_021955 [Tetracentron sinense]